MPRYQGHNSNGEEMSSMTVFRGSMCDTDYYDDLPSMTRQEFAEDADINTLMKRYETSGIIPPTNRMQPRYLDVADVPDMRSALDALNEATEAFMALPATVRRKFDNDPMQFVEFAQNPDNIKDLREWGLAPPEEAPPAPQKVEVVNPSPPGDAPKAS